jgi:large subunit ribosomal protein L25
MERVKLVVKERTEIGGRASGRLRRQGLIPGVLYGAGQPAVPVSIEAHALRDAISTDAGRHAVLEVVLEGRKRGHVAVIQELQLDKVKHVITHVDLREIHLNEPIETKVGVHLEGTARGVKIGGVLDVVWHEVTVRGLPGDIPEHLTIDIEDVDVGQVVRVRDVSVPGGLTVLDDPEQTIFHVMPPRAAEAEAEAELVPAAAAEPEVVGKGGEEEGAAS